MTFPTRQVDIFTIEAVDLQDIKKLVVGHSGSGDGNGWYLEKAILKVPVIDEEETEDDNANNSNSNRTVRYQEYNFLCDR